MPYRFSFTAIKLALPFLLACFFVQAHAQTDDTFGDSAADPVKLFERAQSLHARGELQKAIEYYEQAIKVRPEFPEAEFQRSNALVSLGRLSEAEIGFNRAITQKPNWSLPYSALGALLLRQQKDAEAESALRKAIAIDSRDNVALRLLAELRLHAGDSKAALDFAKRASSDRDAPASAFIVLARAQRTTGDLSGALASLNKVLDGDPANVAALLERADLQTDQKNYETAIADLKAAEKLRSGDKLILARQAYVYQQAGQVDEAQKAAKAAGLEVQTVAGDGKPGVVGTAEEIEAANSADPAIARKALETLLVKNPRNPMLLARLGASYRKDDPAKSMELYRQAAQIQPESADYALGYASALVQARQFGAAAELLRKVIRENPDNYIAHANLATALYELKQYENAVPEYQWILAAKPDVVVAYYFIATAHDYLGEYPEALASYETFLSRADAKTNQLEIDKVKLRLPTLRRQIQLGEGKKQKP
jgi:tetratricopeptide (TPR) repeat protein